MQHSLLHAQGLPALSAGRQRHGRPITQGVGVLNGVSGEHRTLQLRQLVCQRGTGECEEGGVGAQHAGGLLRAGVQGQAHLHVRMHMGVYVCVCAHALIQRQLCSSAVESARSSGCACLGTVAGDVLSKGVLPRCLFEARAEKKCRTCKADSILCLPRLPFSACALMVLFWAAKKDSHPFRLGCAV